MAHGTLCVNLLPVVWNIEANLVALFAALVVTFLSFLFCPIDGSVKHYVTTCDCVKHSVQKLLLCKIFYYQPVSFLNIS
jgi:hypothetical protein